MPECWKRWNNRKKTKIMKKYIADRGTKSTDWKRKVTKMRWKMVASTRAMKKATLTIISRKANLHQQKRKLTLLFKATKQRNLPPNPLQLGKWQWVRSEKASCYFSRTSSHDFIGLSILLIMLVNESKQSDRRYIVLNEDRKRAQNPIIRFTVLCQKSVPQKLSIECWLNRSKQSKQWINNGIVKLIFSWSWRINLKEKYLTYYGKASEFEKQKNIRGQR